MQRIHRSTRNWIKPKNNFLPILGDSIQNAYYPYAAVDTFSAKIFYTKIHDSTMECMILFTVILQILTAQNIIYHLLKWENKGNYVPDLMQPMGKCIKWFQPINGVPREF